MWQYHYYVASLRAAELTREARLARLVQLAVDASPADRPSIVIRARRSGAAVAARVARALDECVAREAFARLAGE